MRNTPLRNWFQIQSHPSRLNNVIRSSHMVVASEMLVLPDFHTLERTMSELLELKMSEVPEMDPNKTSEHN